MGLIFFNLYSNIQFSTVRPRIGGVRPLRPGLRVPLVSPQRGNATPAPSTTAAPTDNAEAEKEQGEQEATQQHVEEVIYVKNIHSSRILFKHIVNIFFIAYVLASRTANDSSRRCLVETEK